MDNIQYPLTSPTAGKYEQGDRQGETIELFHRWFDIMWYFNGQRPREEFKKALEGALKFFPRIKIKPEQELCFQSLVVKRKDVLGVWKSLCRNYVRVLVSQDRDKKDDISASDI